MSAQPATAIDAIGRDEDGMEDWILQPDVHADNLPQAAGPLIRILRSETVSGMIGLYKTHDQDAIKAQARYRSRGRYMVIASTAAVLIGASFLTILSYTGGEGLGIFGSILLAAQFLSLVVMGFLNLQMRENTDFNDWMGARTSAEEARLSLFSTICRPNHISRDLSQGQQPGELPLMELQLEYFRRYQLDVQRSFYHNRARQYRDAFRSLRLAGVWILVVVVILGALQSDILKIVGGELSDLDQAKIGAFAGIVVPIIYQAWDSFKFLAGDRRNVMRYEITKTNLDLIHSKLDPVRAAVARKDEDAAEALENFISAVHEQISVENREWRTLQFSRADELPRPVGVI